ncbi:glycosyltransferase family 2 protein [Acaryochloris sp. IP29b_bin.148]|uniref:glycosyltransferase n=1 Tax=Acaryochloris sp. IP29b_bin.148 TaxID=2969218 RepID=UPI0026187F0B|nr:glycosyltransferase family 2 protein [Acaryochloris sp. IP29b_bin.148]
MTNAVSIIENVPAFSGNIRIRLKDRTLLFRFLVIVNLIFGGWYLQWRIFNSVNFNALWLAIPLLLAEIYSYIGGVMFFIGLWRPIVREVKPLRHMRPTLPESEWPSIDVFITCYNEPVEMVRETAEAALNLDYPATKLKVYVLDDGNSPPMRQMSEQLCIADLQTPQLRAAADGINAQRLQLKTKLQHLQSLVSEIAAGEEALKSHTLTVETKRENVQVALDWFDQLKQPQISIRTWLELQTVLGEGFDNVLKYAHKDLPANTPIDLELNISSNAIILQIWDRGPGLDDPDKIFKSLNEVDLMAEGERGFGIMSECTDFISYNPTFDQRQCLIAIKFYKPEGNLGQDQTHQFTGYLHSLQQTTCLLNQQYGSATEYLQAGVKRIQEAIDQKEQDLIGLARSRYIARPKPKGKPHHAKAGNINYALFSGETTGDLILTLDADHIPKPHFLQRVLPYFFDYSMQYGAYKDNDIAFVQTPQDFYNLPPGDPFGHQARLFYGPIQQGKDGMSSAFYTGTNAILRREALVTTGLQNFADEYLENQKRLEEFELVGGVSSASITEDMNTAMRLHAAGWKSVYHHEVLAVGLAPDDLSSTLKQRLRWAQGTVQVLLQENPLTKKGLTIWQQLQYFQTMYSYFSGFFTLIFIACPLIYFFTGVIPVQTYGLAFAIHFVPAFVLNRITFIAAAWGIKQSELWRAEQFAIALFPLFIKAVWSVFTGRPAQFQVTPKQRQSGVYIGLVIPQLTVVILTFLGISWSLFRYATGSLDNPGLHLLNSAWAIYNVSLTWVLIKAAIWQPPTTTQLE